MKSILLTVVLFVSCQYLLAQNIGIGTSSPDYKLEVIGIIHGTSNAYIDGALGIGTVSPGYKLQVNNGNIAIYNTTDEKTWYFGYTSTSNYFYLSEGGTNRLVVANGGNIGIGVSTPTAKLDINGTLNVRTSADIEGNLTVNAGKGIMRNAQNTGQLKYYTREVAFGTGSLGGFDLSEESSFGFTGFTTTPVVMVGDIVSSGGTVGELYRVQLILYGCNTTSCKARLLNTSPNTVNYSITWNIVCIGN